MDLFTSKLGIVLTHGVDLQHNIRFTYMYSSAGLFHCCRRQQLYYGPSALVYIVGSIGLETTDHVVVCLFQSGRQKNRITKGHARIHIRRWKKTSEKIPVEELKAALAVSKRNSRSPGTTTLSAEGLLGRVRDGGLVKNQAAC